MVRKDVGGGMVSGSRAPALPLRGSSSAHKLTVQPTFRPSALTQKCCHFTTAPERGTVAHSRRSLIEVLLGQGMDGRWTGDGEVW